MKLSLKPKFWHSSRRASVFAVLGVLFLLFGVNEAITSASPGLSDSDVKYRTYFGRCPSRAAGTLTMKLVKEFEKNKSLKDVKEKIVNEKLAKEHFISDYEIDYNPYKKLLKFRFDCPEPLMKVQLYKGNGLESYEAILVENGKLYDPTYEVLLRTEKKLTEELPYLAIPVGKMNKDFQNQIAGLVSKMKPKFRQHLSELILGEKKELTIILSVNGHPSSVFLGKKKWEAKTKKLQRIMDYMQKKKKIPSIVNLTNGKKVVVKFNDRS